MWPGGTLPYPEGALLPGKALQGAFEQPHLVARRHLPMLRQEAHGGVRQGNRLRLGEGLHPLAVQGLETHHADVTVFGARCLPMPATPVDSLRGALRDALDAEQLARDVLEYLAVRSETGSEGPGSDFLAGLLRREGLLPRFHEAVPGRANVYARLPGGDAGPPLLLNGHTDTIPVGAAWPPRREGSWLVGRGAEDMKGGLVAMVHAAAALRRAGVRLCGDLWLTGVVGHETPVGKKEGPRLLIRHLREPGAEDGLPRAAAILIVEGPPAIWCASLGSAVFTVRFHSDRGAVHTLHVPYRENPAAAAGDLLTAFGEWEARFTAAQPHPLCGRERINVGIVRGGDYMNRLPTPLEIVGQRRWKPGYTSGEVEEELRNLAGSLAAARGLRAEVILEGVREPFETGAEEPVVRALLRATALASCEGTPAPLIGMGLVGDANLYANEAGVPTVYYGPAYRTAHSDDERVELQQLVHCAEVYALAAAAFCGVE